MDLGDALRVKCFHAYDVAPGRDAPGEVARRSNERAVSNRSLSRPSAAVESTRTPETSAPALAPVRVRRAGPAAAGKRQGRARRALWAATLLLLALVGVSLWNDEPAAISAAQGQFEALSAEVLDYAAQTGTIPRSLAELGWRLPAIFAGAEARDPWGARWRYRVPGTGDRAFDLGSAGPDHAVGGGDDIGHPFVDGALGRTE